MATVTNFLAKPFPNLISTPKINLLNPNSTSQISFLPKPTTHRVKFDRNFTPKASVKTPSTAVSDDDKVQQIHSTSSVKTPSTAAADDRVQQIYSVSDFVEALTLAKNRLVVVEFADLTSKQSSKIYPSMVNLSRTCDDVVFLHVMRDENELTMKLCRREKIDKFPHFIFYKNKQKIYEEEGIGPDQLTGDMLNYGDNHSNVVDLDTPADLDKLIADPRNDNKLIVLKTGLVGCRPCVSAYPTMVKLSKSMADTVTFARMDLEKNMDFLLKHKVDYLPTYFFIKKGEICGRYAGSGKGALIGETLKYQGVRVTC